MNILEERFIDIAMIMICLGGIIWAALTEQWLAMALFLMVLFGYIFCMRKKIREMLEVKGEIEDMENKK